MSTRIEVDPFILLMAARYALGRSTAAVDTAVAAVISHRAVLADEGWTAGLLADIDEALANGRAGPRDCAEQWQRAADALRAGPRWRGPRHAARR